MTERVSRKRLEELQSILSEKDKSILNSILKHRYLTADQIRRLHFVEFAKAASGLKAANRNLQKLKGLSLIGCFERRVGSIPHGSGPYVWRLEAAGEHLIRLSSDVIRPRKRQFSPSRFFLIHTLAIAECYIRIMELCDGKDLKLVEIQNEPDNWRPYNSGGMMVTLKPDLFAITVSGSYQDSWFIEIDLATESPGKIIEKCYRYHKYYQSGLEQKQYGVFPLVVFIVPDAKRKCSIAHQIQIEFSKLPNIFVVITPGELSDLIRDGAVAPAGVTP